ncbi:MAG: alpha/beta fold hydrolase [Hyphomicrobium sp.]
MHVEQGPPLRISYREVHIVTDSLEPERAVLLERIYDIAVAPERLEELVGYWTGKLEKSVWPATDTSTKLNVLARQEMLSHFDRAESLLKSLLNDSNIQSQTLDEWVAKSRYAAIVFERSGRVAAVNAAARNIFSISVRSDLSALQLEPADEEELRQHLRRRQTASKHPRSLLRLKRKNHREAVIMAVLDPVFEGSDCVGIATTALSWPPALSSLLSLSFQLTDAEVEVVVSLTNGQSISEIAETSGRTEGTIRTHVSSIFRKTETHTQVELVRLTLALFDVASQFSPHHVAPSVFDDGSHKHENIYLPMTLKDGRRFDRMDIGAPHGRPFLLFPGNIGLSRFHPSVEADMARRGIKMIVPIRAGYGNSSRPPADRDVVDVVASDTIELLEHLKLPRVPIVCMTSDLQFAVTVAKFAPDRISAIISANASWPPIAGNQIDRLDYFSRFVIKNARSAPRAMTFISLLFFALERRVGTRGFLRTVLKGSAADMLLIEQDDIMDTLVRGSHFVSAPQFKAYQVWAEEVLAFVKDWRPDLLNCPVPTVFLTGDQSPWAPLETINEYKSEMPQSKWTAFQNTGALLAHQHPQELLREVMAWL